MKPYFLSILFFLWCLPVFLFAQTYPGFYDPLLRESTIVTNGKDSVYVLPHQCLIPGAFELRRGNTRLEYGQTYEVSATRGELIFKMIPDSGENYTASYRIFPFHLRLKYSHWQVSDTLSSIPGTPKTRVRKLLSSTPSYGEELQSSGSIFRGITIGTNQGMRLQSGLRLQVSGKIASNVELVASLTDQNTPIQPEGNTQTLQEIDKVFIDIKMPHFKTTLGDFVYRVDGSEFGTYSRKLQGAMGTVDTDRGSLSFSVAASKGQFTTNHFIGQEGNQGPYQLTGAAGQREIIVLAGTERVWIDGEPMTRGEDNDYVIEYGNGQITFTRNRLVTSDSRITVDFEYSDQQFQKTIYGFSGNTTLWNDRIRFKASFLREGDDKDNPLNVVLTDTYKNVLEQAGDNSDSARVSGAEYAGENQGYYDRIDTLGAVYYQYVGAEKGDYIVRFSYVGEGQGDYSFQGYGIYRYEGAGQGDYSPVVFLPLAQRHQMFNVASSVDLGKGLIFESEAALSDQDRNLYSPKNDQNNIGLAYQGRLRMNNQPVGLFGQTLGRFGFEAKYYRVNDEFRSLGRMSEVEHGRRWGIEEGDYWGEQIQELEVFYEPINLWSLRGEMGRFKKSGNYSSNRKLIETDFHPSKLPQIQYRAELIESEKGSNLRGYWLRHRGSIKAKFWIFDPVVLYDGEHRKEESPDSILSGFRFDEWTGQLGLGRRSIRLRIDEVIRDERKYIFSTLEKNSLAKTDRLQLEWQCKNYLSTSFMITHRNRDYVDPSQEDQKTDLADVKMRFSSGRSFLDGNLNYQFSSTRISQMVKDTIQVGEGLGNYRYDEYLNEYVPDADGDVIFRTLQTGTFLPVNTLKGGLELRLNSARLWQKPRGILRLISSLKSLSRFRIERKDEDQNFIHVNRSAIRPQWGADTTLVSGLFSYYQDLEYTPPKSQYSIKLRYRQEDSENHQFEQESTIRHFSEQGIRIKGNPLKKIGLLFEYQKHVETKTYQSGFNADRSIRSYLWTVEASYRPVQKIEIALKGKIQTAKDFVPRPTTEAVSFFIVPGFSYAFLGKGHLRAELELGEVRSEPSGRSLPYEMFGGDQPGRTVRWNVLMTYKVSGHVMVTLNYRARKEPWRKRLYQIGQMEVRAFF